MIIYEFSLTLVQEYSKTHRVYKKEYLAIALCNVLGNLYIRSQKAQYLQNAGRGYEGILLFPMNNALFAKTQMTDPKYSIVKQNIAALGLTKQNKQIMINILVTNSISTVFEGRWQGASTIIMLNNPLDWIKPYLNDSVIYNLKLYAAICGNHLEPLKYENYEEDTRPIASIKCYVNGKDYYYIKASDEAIEATNRINNLLPEDIRSFYTYKRIFIQDELSSGRFYSSFNKMPKAIRKLLMGKSGYEEIDIKGFVPNVLKQFMDGEYFSERPYKVVARQLLKQKLRKSIKYFDEDFIDLLADCIKQTILIIFNNDRISEEDINNLDIDPKAWEALIEHGLANTIQELRIAHSSSTYSTYKQRQQQLYNMRKNRWEKTVKGDYECPTFIVKPSNVLAAMKKSMPELMAFNFTSNWDWTQLIESELLVDLSVELEKDRLLPLFIHDALYVPYSYKDKYTTLAYSLLPNIVNSYKNSIFTPENISYTLNSFSSLVISFLDTVEFEYLSNKYKSNTLKDIEIKSVANKIKKSIPDRLINFYRDEYNRFILPLLRREYRNDYQFIKSIILNKLRE